MLTLLLAVADDAARDRLDQLYNTYYSLMIAVAMRTMKNEQDAQDVVQDAILKVVGHLDTLDGLSEVQIKAYLCAVVRHRAVDVLRKRARQGCEALDALAETLESPELPPPEWVISREGYAALLREIDALGETDRAICQLKFISRCSEREIAALLGLTPKAVNVRAVRARKKLIERIRAREGK